MRYALLLSFIPFFANSQNVLEKIVADDPWLSEVVNNPNFQTQIIYTQIDRSKENKPTFSSYKLGVDENTYFYPASTVKMPAAIVALEKLQELDIIDLSRDSKLEIHAGREPQTAVKMDSTAMDQNASVAQYIKKVFVVSDNDAYNRLYEFLGQAYFNEALQQKGYQSTRVIHRLGPEGFPFGYEENQYTNAISFYDGDRLIYHQGEVHSIAKTNLPSLRNQSKGVAHIDKQDQLVQQPFDFSVKNFFSLQDLHDVLKAVIFPASTSSYKRFDLSESDYEFLYEWMSKTPQESGIAQYGDKADNYVKFFWNGDAPGTIPDNIKIFNKVGWAYGFLTDVSYVIDTENKVEYLLAATIHVNENEVYNDGEYEYDTIGLPFFSKLGRVIYDQELKRRRRYKPDFSWLGNLE